MSSLTRWNPVRELITMREALDRFVDETFRGTRGSGVSAWALPIDAYATQDAIVLVADVPGVNANDLQITFEGDTLTIRGEIKPAEQKNYLLRERMFGNFERTLTVNTPVDGDKIDARFDNGVLTLTLPKAEAAKPKQISIKTKVGS